METHVKVLGVLQIALGAMGLFGAGVLMLLFGGVAGIVGANANADAAIAMPIIGITGAALVTFLTVLSLPSVIVGIGLLRLRPWARIGGIVISILSLMAIPLGTIVGAYGLWVLFSTETERLFNSQAIAAPRS
jgi:hypothetical protein